MAQPVLEKMIKDIDALRTRLEVLETQERGGAWVDYSATSTITGWSSFTTKHLRYMVVGKIVYVAVDPAGTSNSTATNFTLPYAQTSAVGINVPARAQDNGAAFAWGIVTLAVSWGCSNM